MLPDGGTFARRYAASALVLVALTLAALSCPSGENGTPPLERMLRLELWGAGLNDAVREIKAQTGVDVLFYRPDLPADRNTDNVYLVTGRVPLRTVMECLARRFAFRYRLSESGKIELSKGYGWVGGDPALRILRLESLTPASGGDPEQVERLLAEFVKPLPLLPGDYSLTLERYPTPENSEALRCVAALPPVLGDYLEKAARCLSGEAGDQPSGNDADKGTFASAGRVRPDWEGLLTRSVSSPSGGELRAVLSELARQADIAVMIPPPSASVAPPLMDLNAGRTGLGQASEELSTRYALGRRVFLASGAILFEGGTGDPELDARSRELFWNGLAVTGFDARAAADRLGGEAALLAMLKREAFPELWRDPACGMGYSPVTGRLAVAAPLNVMEAIEKLLANAGR